MQESDIFVAVLLRFLCIFEIRINNNLYLGLLIQRSFTRLCDL